jgi:TPR repeat protein
MQSLNRLSADTAQCQFALGQRAYSDKRFTDAANHWRRVVAIEPQSIQDMIIFAAAHGTLGFLYYAGLGVERDIDKAMTLLKRSVKLGGVEARRHLGLIYENKNYKFFDPVVAYAWYRSVEHFYKPVPTESSAQRVLERARLNVEDMKAVLTSDELKKAEELSWTIE